ncbi:hypothetical protein PsorP6_002601 [Peronosclerospora sorghi]|uniref:Uncharacterized protein n=1 Tax=Peronosclerospora sorghi TaxID=230839 RepID=A0ACC0WTU9_9STRA|nr:hypothetical protein PsorP6_002601 [Peronosclerospora sorghi]
MSRWGREIVDDGEDECTPSTAIAHLAMMTAHPTDEWPSSPCDQESVNFLTRGTSSYSEKTAGTALKDFFDILEMEFQSKLESQQHVRGVINPIKAQFSQLRYTTEQVVQISVSPSNCLTNFNVRNASCSKRQFVVTEDCPINPEFPLEAVDVKQFVTFADPELNSRQHYPTLLSLDEPERNALAIANLQKLIHMCANMRTCDRRLVEEGIKTLEVEANEIRGDISENSGLMVAANRFVLERPSGWYPWVTFDCLTSLLTSESLEADLKSRNTFVGNVTDEGVAKILLRNTEWSTKVKMTRQASGDLADMPPCRCRRCGV